MHPVPNRQIFTARLSLKPWMCVSTVLCVANTKGWLFQYSVMCSGGWKHSRVHPIKRLPLVCVWFRVTMGTMEPGWQWRPLVTTGRMHSAGPVNPSQVPISERFLNPQGSLKQRAKAGGGLGDSLISSSGQSMDLVAGQDVKYFVPNLAYTYIQYVPTKWALVASLVP